MPASSNANRKKFERRGHHAETVALILLRLKGYRLLARRFKSHHGEIDLIMRRGQTTPPDYGWQKTQKLRPVFAGLILSR
jgi:hypothetical protein